MWVMVKFFAKGHSLKTSTAEKTCGLVQHASRQSCRHHDFVVEDIYHEARGVSVMEPEVVVWDRLCISGFQAPQRCS